MITRKEFPLRGTLLNQDRETRFRPVSLPSKERKKMLDSTIIPVLTGLLEGREIFLVSTQKVL